MSHITLPQPPQSSLPTLRTAVVAPAAGSRTAGAFKALDFAFLVRCLVITPLMGAAFALVLLSWSHSLYLAASYFAGTVFGTVMLGSLVLFVRRLAAPKLKQPYNGWDARIPLWVVAVLKYVAFFVVAWGVALHGWAQPFAFVIGIALVQLVILVRALGRKMVSRSIAEIYVDNAKR